VYHYVSLHAECKDVEVVINYRNDAGHDHSTFLYICFQQLSQAHLKPVFIEYSPSGHEHAHDDGSQN
jgi:hypothetical protein